ncbi:MAG: M28 family peptidase [Ignavibacteriae bacterium]|nr:M28 family peptidase [Ignavibacteriota bacterium]
MKNINKNFLFILLIFSSPIIFAQNIFEKTNFNFDRNSFQKHLEILGSDLYQGRGTGTKGGELAANYIAEKFKEINLSEPENSNSYFQEVPLHGSIALENSKLIVYAEDDTFQLNYKKDYLLVNTGEQTIIPYPIEITFSGYGIIAPEFDHYDYTENDVTGKISMILSGEPETDDPDFFNGDEPTIYSYNDVKNRIALSRGASGTLILPNMEAADSNSWNKLTNEYSFEDINLLYSASENFSIIINPQTAKRIFNISSENSFEEIKRNLSGKKYQLKFEGNFHQRDFIANNVIGIINPIEKENDEAIIISAHYDHLGIGTIVNGDSIYNGVLDNAIGVAALIEIAKILKLNENILNRTIILMAVTGEEKGLLGSTYYTDHPIFPLYKTIANLNIDGIAYLDNFNSIVGIGSEFSNLDEFINKTANLLNLKISEIPPEFYNQEAFNRSDQIAFAKAGIPSVLILDGIDYENLSRKEALRQIFYFNENIYHTPFDDLKININFDAVKKHVEFLTLLIMQIANSTSEINWKENSPYNFTRLQTKAEKR